MRLPNPSGARSSVRDAFTPDRSIDTQFANIVRNARKSEVSSQSVTLQTRNTDEKISRLQTKNISLLDESYSQVVQHNNIIREIISLIADMGGGGGDRPNRPRLGFVPPARPYRPGGRRYGAAREELARRRLDRIREARSQRANRQATNVNKQTLINARRDLYQRDNRFRLNNMSPAQRVILAERGVMRFNSAGIPINARGQILSAEAVNRELDAVRRVEQDNNRRNRSRVSEELRFAGRATVGTGAGAGIGAIIGGGTRFLAQTAATRALRGGGELTEQDRAQIREATTAAAQTGAIVGGGLATAQAITTRLLRSAVSRAGVFTRLPHVAIGYNLYDAYRRARFEGDLGGSLRSLGIALGTAATSAFAVSGLVPVAIATGSLTLAATIEQIARDIRREVYQTVYETNPDNDPPDVQAERFRNVDNWLWISMGLILDELRPSWEPQSRQILRSTEIINRHYSRLVDERNRINQILNDENVTEALVIRRDLINNFIRAVEVYQTSRDGTALPVRLRAVENTLDAILRDTTSIAPVQNTQQTSENRGTPQSRAPVATSALSPSGPTAFTPVSFATNQSGFSDNLTAVNQALSAFISPFEYDTLEFDKLTFDADKIIFEGNPVSADPQTTGMGSGSITNISFGGMNPSGSGTGAQPGSQSGAMTPWNGSGTSQQSGEPTADAVQISPGALTLGSEAVMSARRSAGGREGELAALGQQSIDPAALRDVLATRLGLQPFQAAGLVSNFYAESGLRPGVTRQGGTDFGLAQWVGIRPGGRLYQLRELARRTGRDPTDPQVQIDFIVQEFTTNPYFRRVLERIRAARTPQEAGMAAHEYESGGARQFEHLRGWHARASNAIANLPRSGAMLDNASRESEQQRREMETRRQRTQQPPAPPSSSTPRIPQGRPELHTSIDVPLSLRIRQTAQVGQIATV